MDENDKLRNGLLPKDPTAGTHAANGAGRKREEDDAPKVLTVKDLFADVISRIGTRRNWQDVCLTGHHELDAATAGFRPGFCWVFGADTSWGKSSWLVSIADLNIKRGKRVLIVSAEDPPSLYADRLIVRRAKVNADRYRKDRMTEDETERVCAVAAAGEDVPVYVHAARKPIEKLVEHLSKTIRLQHIDLIAFDYLQEFTSNGRHQDERVRFREIAACMRALVRSHGISGIIFSQLTMTADTKWPSKQNIRECRDVANAAEVVAIGFEPETSVMIGEEVKYRAGQKYLLIDKNKDGPRGAKIEMQWNSEWAGFEQVEDPELERLESMSPAFDNERGNHWQDEL